LKLRFHILCSLLFAGPALTAGYQTPPNYTPSGPLVINNQNKVTIQNLHITNPNGDCVQITNSTSVTITNSEIGKCKGNGIVVTGGGMVNIYDNYIHPEGTLNGCCDETDGVFAQGVAGLTIQGNVIAFGEANIEVQRSSNVKVKGNFLLNPRNDESRGQQFQCYDKCRTVRVENNYTLASKSTRYAYPANQEDAINIIGGPSGPTSDVIVQNNYVQGGFSDSGCGVIADSHPADVQFLNNILVDTGQCGIGIAAGVNVRVDHNKILNRTFVKGGGNTAMYVWKQYPKDQCDQIAVTKNILYGVKPDGSISSWWNGGGCTNLTFTGNTLNQAAYNALTPPETKIPPPVIPPLPFQCAVPSPWTNSPNVCGKNSDTIPPKAPTGPAPH